jgi:hypothetical protein
MAARRHTYWIIGGFISALLISLVALPLILNHRMGTIIAELTDQTDPAQKESGQIHAALSRELFAVLAFQATGASEYTALYREQDRTTYAGGKDGSSVYDGEFRIRGFGSYCNPFGCEYSPFNAKRYSRPR